METEEKANHSPIYLVSGSTGASGEQLVQTVLAQFPECQVPVITLPRVRDEEQVEDVVAKAKSTGGTIVHTMVDAQLRRSLSQLAEDQGVVCIDLMGDLLIRLSEVLDQEPIGRPGLYRQQHHTYFERVAAIEFAMTHDDGKNRDGWPDAEIVLTGVSRVGKTPLSMYLSVLSWKVANIPLVSSIPAPPELFQLDHRRVIGLTIDPGQLVIHRQQRQSRLGAPGPSDYTDPAAIYEELQAAQRVFQQGRFTVVNVTDKPIETSADEIIERVTRQLRRDVHKR
jgi:regulator of PEP synthase PpsR (kinase-PPPase family)